MSDPERISKRSSGLAAELLQAGADEQPSPAGLARTLAALGATGAVLTTASAASGAGAPAIGASGACAAGSAATVAATATGAKTLNAVSALLLAKWIGLGVVGGVCLAGAAAVVSGPAASSHTAPLARSPVAASQPTAARAVAAVSPTRPSEAAALPAAELTPPATRPPASTASEVALRAASSSPQAAAPEPLEVGVPLAAEVAFVDGARAALAAGDTERGLAQLRRYELQFPEARLLPEVLFLRMEASERLGRSSEARAAAARLVEGFPRSPHVARARKLLASASPDR